MKIGVDAAKCQGHARCEAMSDFFTLDDDGYSTIGPAKPVPPGMEAEVQGGVVSCPEGALFEVSEA